MKTFMKFLCCVAFNAIVGATVCAAAGFNPLVGAVATNGIAGIAGFLPDESGILREGVYVELWTGELVKKLRAGLEGSWLDGIPDYSQAVEKDVIHLVDVGGDPTVLIDNTTYPLELEELEDGDIAISLSKFETKPTPVRDDELYAISYDKMARVKESHGDAINECKFIKAAHALCANSHTASTPVFATSGDVDPETGRKRFTKADIIKLKATMDKMGIPVGDRRLVLCPEHANDMLLWDENFARQYNIDNNTGKIARLYGFDIYEFNGNPLYTTAGVKKAVGSSADTGEFQCSFAFWTKRVFKATGSTKMYYSDASTDPFNHRSVVDFLHRFICLFKKADAGVVMRSAYSSSDAPTISGADSIEDFAATAGSKYRTYATSNGAPVTAQSNVDWLTVAVGSDGKKVTFTVAEYAYAAEGDNPRIGTATIGIEGTEVTKTVTVKQAMASEA